MDFRNEFDTEKEYLDKIADLKAKADEIKQHLVDDSIVDSHNFISITCKKYLTEDSENETK